MRKKLTPKTIDSLPPAKGKRYEVRDELLTGCTFECLPMGVRFGILAPASPDVLDA